MYISSVSIENFRAFKEKTVFHFNPGVKKIPIMKYILLLHFQT